MIREALVDNLHQRVIYPILVSGDAQKNQEIAHDRIMRLLEEIERRPLLRKAITRAFEYHDPKLQVEIAGLNFENPLGIAAGFDKDGMVPNAICALGYSHIEIGTVTPLPQMGAAQPRVFRLPEDGAMINRMGFPSEGMDFVFKKLSEDRQDPGKIWGINIGANITSVKEEKAIDDYTNAASRLINCGDYLALNISSPNTEGLRRLQDKKSLDELLKEASAVIKGRQEAIHFLYFGKNSKVPLESVRKTPLFIKIAPDLTLKQLHEILDVSVDRIDGIIATNSSIATATKNGLQSKYKEETGGISGKPLTKLALEMNRFIYLQTNGKLPLIRSGGVMTPQDYWEALTYGGASLVQLYTAFTDRATSTPNLAYYMNKSVAERMKELGVNNLKDIRGMKEEAMNYWAVR